MTRRIFFIALMLTPLFHSCKKDESKKKETTMKTQPTEKIVAQEKIELKKVPKKEIIHIDKELLIGSWIDTSKYALHFTINSNGKAHSDNMKTLLYEKWRLDGNKITFTIKNIGNHTTTVSDETYEIKQLDREKLVLTSKDITLKYQRKQKKQPTVTNIKPGQKITSPVKININSEGVWFASEGQLGTVEIIDEKGNVLNKKDDYGFLLIVSGNWMSSEPAIFEGKVTFNARGAKKGKIKIYSEPGEGEGVEAGVLYILEIPVTF